MANKKLKVGNVPNLRFPEFDGKWEIKKLGEVATNKSKKYNPENATDSIKCIELEHLAGETGQLLGYTDGSKSGSIKNVFNEGDVLFGKLRPYLKKYLIASFDGVCSSEIWVLKGKDISNDFLYRIIQTNSFIDLANQSSGSKMPRADWNVVENGVYSIPSLEEQKKIASFLSLIDKRIQTQNKIILELGSLIIGTSEKLFSQRLRFKDDNGNDFPDWEEKVLGEVVEFRNGKAHENDIDENGKYIVINSKFISQNGNVRKYSNECIMPLYKDEIVLVMSDVPNGKALAKCFLINENDKYTLNQRICALKAISSHNPFLYYLINRNEYYLSFDSGVGQTNLRKDEVLNCPLIIPSSTTEQIKIANFLSSIDVKIEIEKQLLTQYENQKKYLLQNLFV
jgi:type I restriction enzyme S subunit